MRAAWSALATLAVASATGCDQPPPERPGVVVEFDGHVIRDDDVAPYRTYLESIGERLGPAYVTAAVLEQHLVPLALARKAFASERAELERQARGFQESVMAAGGADPQLRAKGAIVGGQAAEVGRGNLDLAQAAWCFTLDEHGQLAHFGQSSPVIETPRGFCVLSFRDHVPGVTRAADRIDLFVVTFYTHASYSAYKAWYQSEKLRLAGAATYVGEAYRDAIPAWLKP